MYVITTNCPGGKVFPMKVTRKEYEDHVRETGHTPTIFGTVEKAQEACDRVNAGEEMDNG